MKALLSGLLIFVVSNTTFAYEFDSNVPSDIRQQTIDDLNFMKSITSDETSALHQQIFGNVDGAVYTKFFEDRVLKIGMNSCGSSSAVACVIPWYGKKIWFTQNYIKFQHPQISRMMVVYHEARHTESENGNWSHADCPVPFLDENGENMKSIWTGAELAGKPACDITPEGSYGSSMIMLKNISKFCTSCNEKVKLDAGIYADDQFARVVDAGAREAIINDLYKTAAQ